MKESEVEYGIHHTRYITRPVQHTGLIKTHIYFYKILYFTLMIDYVLKYDYA